MPIKVTIWNEFRHEKQHERIAKVYPKGIHGAIAEGLSKDAEIQVRTATLDEPEHGLTDEVLNNTDVLIWWYGGDTWLIMKLGMILFKKYMNEY